jgi:hypothetical protein
MLFVASSHPTPSNFSRTPSSHEEGAIAVNQEQGATGPGIVVLSPSLQILHMNQRAIALLAQWERADQSIGTDQALAAPLHQHCQDILETMQERLGSNNWEQFQQFRTIGNSTHQILLKGFGLPDRRGLPHSRIVMLLSPHNPVSMQVIDGRESSSFVVRDVPGYSGLSGSTSCAG